MIQRIQTIYMIAAAASMLLLFIFNPLATLADYRFLLDYIHFYNLSIGIVLLVNIFLFKNRPFQIKMNSFMNVLLLIEAGFWGIMFGFLMEFSVVFFILFLLPLAFVLLVIANRCIKKDEELVRSVDRLR